MQIYSRKVNLRVSFRSFYEAPGGPIGNTCTAGTNGPAGIIGWTGPTSSTGTTGPTGLPGIT